MKTKKMLEIESRLGEPIENYLRREYWRERKNSRQIAKSLHVSNVSILNWLDYFNISIRTNVEAQLIHLETGRPKKKELRNLYTLERKSTTQIARSYEVANGTVYNWLRFYGIPIRTIAESKLLENSRKPSKEELEECIIHLSRRQIARNLGVSDTSVRNWLREYGITQDKENIKLENLLENYIGEVEE